MSSDVLECSLCFELYDGGDHCPRLLACGHSFCSDCLSQLLDDNKQEIVCPHDRRSFADLSSIDDLAKNFALLDVISARPPPPPPPTTTSTTTTTTLVATSPDTIASTNNDAKASNQDDADNKKNGKSSDENNDGESNQDENEVDFDKYDRADIITWKKTAPLDVSDDDAESDTKINNNDNNNDDHHKDNNKDDDNDDDDGPKCDICTEQHGAGFRCITCEQNLCHLLAAAHLKSKETGNHEVHSFYAKYLATNDNSINTKMYGEEGSRVTSPDHIGIPDRKQPTSSSGPASSSPAKPLTSVYLWDGRGLFTTKEMYPIDTKLEDILGNKQDNDNVDNKIDSQQGKKSSFYAVPWIRDGKTSHKYKTLSNWPVKTGAQLWNISTQPITVSSYNEVDRLQWIPYDSYQIQTRRRKLISASGRKHCDIQGTFHSFYIHIYTLQGKRLTSGMGLAIRNYEEYN